MAVRRESVVVTLVDEFSRPGAVIAARARYMADEVRRIGTASGKTSTSVRGLGRDVDQLERPFRRSSAEIDKFSGRLRVAAQLGAALGPSLIPAGAVAVPALTTLSATLGFVVTAGAATIASFQGVGDALEAVNKAHLEPTTENLEAAQVALENLSPAAADLVGQLSALRPVLLNLRDIGAENLMPGVTEAIDTLLQRLPEVERIAATVNSEVGTILADGAESLVSDRWTEFFDFVATDTPPALASLARSIGSVTHAATELWMAFDPVNDSGLTWLEDSAASLDRWATGLEDTRGFQEFMAYLRETGPQVADTLGQISLAVVRILEAGAPLGGPILEAFEGIARAISTIADSNIGTPIIAAVAALSALSRTQAAYSRISQTTWATNIRGADGFAGKLSAAEKPLRRGAGLMAGLSVAALGLGDSFGLANTTSLALMGTVAGPWGAAFGAGAGLLLDFAGNQQKAAADAQVLAATLDQQTGAITGNTRALVAQRLEADGTLKTAQTLGLNLADVTEAALGNAEAVARVNDELDRFIYGSAPEGMDYEAFNRLSVAASGVRDTLGGQNEELDKAVAGTERMADATAGTSSELQTNTRTLRENLDAMRARTDAAREAFDAETSWRRALVEARKAAKENNAGIDGNTDAALRNRDALSGLANAWENQAPIVRNNVARYREARAQFIETAEGMGVARDRAKELADRMLDIPKSVATKIAVETGPALGRIASLEARLRAIRDEDVFINVRHLRVPDGGHFGPVACDLDAPLPTYLSEEPAA